VAGAIGLYLELGHRDPEKNLACLILVPEEQGWRDLVLKKKTSESLGLSRA
jgi:hypothetical protein